METNSHTPKRMVGLEYFKLTKPTQEITLNTGEKLNPIITLTTLEGKKYQIAKYISYATFGIEHYIILVEREDGRYNIYPYIHPEISQILKFL